MELSDPSLATPPTIELLTEIGQTTSEHITVSLELRADSEVGLRSVRIFSDGRLVREELVSQKGYRGRIIIDVPAHARWISAQAVDQNGYESIPMLTSISVDQKNQARSGGRLFVLAVGTDNYVDRRLPPLTFARTDATTFTSLAKAALGRYYRDIVTDMILDQSNFKSMLAAKLSAIAKAANPEDTIMLFVAGHGVRDRAGRFYLTGFDTSMDTLQATAVSSSEVIAVLGEVKARVIVFLDTCHSGSADGLATNDEAAAAFLDRSAAFTIVAASKGRQESQERKALAGGVFTRALERAVTTDRANTDSNRNGVVELTELYRSVKRLVVEATDGQQTPWIARNNMVGEIPLF